MSLQGDIISFNPVQSYVKLGVLALKVVERDTELLVLALHNSDFVLEDRLICLDNSQTSLKLLRLIFVHTEHSSDCINLHLKSIDFRLKINVSVLVNDNLCVCIQRSLFKALKLGYKLLGHMLVVLDKLDRFIDLVLNQGHLLSEARHLVAFDGQVSLDIRLAGLD